MNVSQRPRLLVFTATRAEYGLLRWIVLEAQRHFEVVLAVGGTHLSPEDGYTLREIQKDPVERLVEVPFLLPNRDAAGLTESVGVGLTRISGVFSMARPDFLLVLGDRYELYIPVVAAILHGVPIVHIHGGEQTRGAIDEQIRHCITKTAHAHFVISESCARVVSNMGEEDWRIHIIGAPGLENIRRMEPLDEDAIRERTGMDMTRPTLFCTYHPPTVEDAIGIQDQMDALVGALDKLDAQVIFTQPNAEAGSDTIVRCIRERVAAQPGKYHFHSSLGTQLYHSIVRKCLAVVGNSSSGLLEAPFLGVPTVDIGERQAGRERAPSVLHCGYGREEILQAIRTAGWDAGFRSRAMQVRLHIGDGHASRHALAALDQLSQLPRARLLTKTLDFEVRESEWHRYWS